MRVKIRLTGHAVWQFQGKVRGHKGGVSKGLFLFSIFFHFFQRKVRAGIKVASWAGCLGFRNNKIMKWWILKVGSRKGWVLCRCVLVQVVIYRGVFVLYMTTGGMWRDGERALRDAKKVSESQREKEKERERERKRGKGAGLSLSLSLFLSLSSGQTGCGQEVHVSECSWVRERMLERFRIRLCVSGFRV